LLIYAGSEGMAGAAALAAEAAFRAGAGLVRIASPAGNREILQTLVTEATFLDANALDPGDLETMHVLIAGPGIGRTDDAWRALQQVLEYMPGKPALLDADALNLLAHHEGMLRSIADARPLVITPHAQELSRLTGNSLDDITADAPAAARAAARDFGCAVLLKGQPTLIAQPDGELWVNSVGSSDVATAGMGDQLAGVIGALLGTVEDPARAAALGLYLSARAADVVNRGRSLTPRDVTSAFPDIFRDLGPRRSPLDLPFVTFDQPQRW
jgi:NAD(P)H-hydrate epimerase